MPTHTPPDVPPFGDALWKPWFVITMGWRRWGEEARRKWARELRKACAKTISEIDAYLEPNVVHVQIGPPLTYDAGYAAGLAAGRNGR